MYVRRMVYTHISLSLLNICNVYIEPCHIDIIPNDYLQEVTMLGISKINTIVASAFPVLRDLFHIFPQAKGPEVVDLFSTPL